MVAVGLTLSSGLQAQITEVGQFPGDLVEDFESFSIGNPGDSFAVFGGAATHNKLFGTSPAIWSSGAWGLGDNGGAQAFDGTQGFGINSNAQGEFVFTTPIFSFGAYFGTAWSGDTMVVRFFDASDVQIGVDQVFSYSRPDDGILEWHGWMIAVEVTRVVWGSLSESGAAPALDSIRVTESPIPVELESFAIER